MLDAGPVQYNGIGNSRRGLLESTAVNGCLPAGESAGYALPEWIKGLDVYVQANPGLSVMLSDWNNLSYGRTASFTGYVSNTNLKNVKADNGEYLNFNQPLSMRVNAQQADTENRNHYR